MCISMHPGGFPPVSLFASICNCIQLALLMEKYAEEKSPKFRVQVENVCLVRGKETKEET